MTLDTAFRLAIALAALTAAIIAAVFRSDHVGQAGRPRPNPGAPRSDRTTRWLLASVSVVLGGLVAGAAIKPQGMAPWQIGLSSLWRGIGIPVVLAGLVLFRQSLLALGRSWANSDRPYADSILVTEGVYRWVRHPYYTATFLLLTGITLLANQWPIAIGSLFLAALLGLRAHREEIYLAEKFGAPYRLYKNRTGMFIPQAGIWKRS
jgi:protein-S-isoprenylcysteine O-methyltransferase Ste14